MPEFWWPQPSSALSPNTSDFASPMALWRGYCCWWWRRPTAPAMPMRRGRPDLNRAGNAGASHHLSAPRRTRRNAIARRRAPAATSKRGSASNCVARPKHRQIRRRQGATAVAARQASKTKGPGRTGALKDWCDQTTRSTIIFLISAIALAGFSPFGQVLAQFMMVWQRYSLNGSSRPSNRSPVASSRLSMIQR